MANVNHATLPNAELHECKGAATASSGQVPVASGSGTAPFGFLPYTLAVTLPDLSTASSIFIVVPFTGTITKIYSVIGAAIATADAMLSFEIAGTPITGADISVSFSGSAAGDIDESTPSGANTITAGQAVEVISDGASSNSCPTTVTFLIQRTA